MAYRRPVLASLRALALFTVLWAFAARQVNGQVTLSADGLGNTYELINQTLGGNIVEVPDCIHTSFGRHIAEVFDATLQKNVFVFIAHVTPDNDRCDKTDRQRVEIKTYNQSPAHLKGAYGETVTYRWKFKLPAGFQPTRSFTHIHQIKPGDGPEDLPVFTLTPRLKSNGSIWMELIHVGPNAVRTVPVEVPLAPFLDQWVEVIERITYSSTGQYELIIKRLSDGVSVMAYQNQNINIWRSGTTFMRPKWGIYRSLDNPSQMRDEEVRFADFCIAEGTAICADAANPLWVPEGKDAPKSGLKVFPNPMQASSVARFTLKKEGVTSLEVIQLAGQGHQVVFDKWLSAGEHQVALPTQVKGPGLYVLRLRQKSFQETTLFVCP